MMGADPRPAEVGNSKREAAEPTEMVSLRRVREIIRRVECYYPPSIFIPPPRGTTPDCYTAAGARLACKLILEELEKDKP